MDDKRYTFGDYPHALLIRLILAINLQAADFPAESRRNS
jgi:hypothetical protein